MSPLKSAEGSFTAMLLSEEPGFLPIVSIQRTRGTRVRVRKMAMAVGLERNKWKEEGRKVWKEARLCRGDTPETNDSIIE